MKRILFKQNSSQKIYDDYFKRIEKTIAVLAPEDREDILMEINSHFYEGLQASTENNEVDTLLDITEKLGMPEDVFKPVVAEKKLNQAVRTFNPKHFFQAFILNMNRTGVFILISLCVLFSIGLGATIVFKIIFPKQTGLVIQNGHLKFFGFGASDIANEDVLGNWYIPFTLLIITISYFITVFLLRLIRKK
jgi:uncharacterized membrane protein